MVGGLCWAMLLLLCCLWCFAGADCWFGVVILMCINCFASDVKML